MNRIKTNYEYAKEPLKEYNPEEFAKIMKYNFRLPEQREYIYSLDDFCLYYCINDNHKKIICKQLENYTNGFSFNDMDINSYINYILNYKIDAEFEHKIKENLNKINIDKLIFILTILTNNCKYYEGVIEYEENKLYKGVVINKGFNDKYYEQKKYIKNIKVGSEFYINKLFSTSTKKNIAEEFARLAAYPTILYTIEIDGFIKGLKIDSQETLLDESEVLLPPRTKFKVIECKELKQTSYQKGRDEEFREIFEEIKKATGHSELDKIEEYLNGFPKTDPIYKKYQQYKYYYPVKDYCIKIKPINNRKIDDLKYIKFFKYLLENWNKDLNNTEKEFIYSYFKELRNNS